MWVEQNARESVRIDGIKITLGPPLWEEGFALDRSPGYAVFFFGPGGIFVRRRWIAASTMAEAIAQVDERWPVPAWWLELRAEDDAEDAEGAAPGPFGGGT